MHHFLRRHQAGFTLIELLVVLVIMSLITLVFVENQSKFDSSTVMRSLAYQVALTVRQAQVYGTSVVQNPGSATGVFGPYYGISFGDAPDSYSIFSDSNANAVGEFDGSSYVNTLKTYTVNNEYAVQEVCATTSTSQWRCSKGDDSSGSGSITTLNVMFKRPNPDAQIQVFHSDHSTIAGDSYTTAYVQLAAINSDVRVVKVTLTGEITVCGVGNINNAKSATNFTLASIKAGVAVC